MEDFDDFNDSPRNLDGDGAIEMCLFFHEDEKNKTKKPPGNSGCCVAFLVLGK